MKRSYNINSFSGGLNNNTNPRDIKDDQLQVLNGFDNETPGKLKLVGSIVDEDGSTYTESHNNTWQYGNGLVHINLDRDVPSGSLAATELYIINDYVNKNVDIYNPATNSIDSAEINYGGSSSSKIDTFVIDGQVRISPTGFVSDSTPQWYGYIDKTYTLGVSGLTHGDGDGDGTDAISKDYASYFNTKMHLSPLNTSDGYSYDPNKFGVGDTSIITNTTAEVILNDGLTYPGDVSGIQIDQNLNTHAALHTILNKQTSAMSEGYGHLGVYAWFHENTNAVNQNDVGDANIPVYGNGSGITYALFASNVYDDQESAPIYIGDIKQPSLTLSTSIHMRPLYLMIAGRMPNNPRQSGVNLYWAQNTDGSFGQKYLLSEINFTNGLRYGGTDNYLPFTTFTSTRKYFIFPISNSNASLVYGNIINSLSQIEPYLNDSQSVIGRPGSGFKTSTIANRRAYIGNVAYYEKGERVIKPDTVLKSGVNQFDNFSAEDFIDVEVNDGDEIIALESLGNKLLQFKQKTLYVINIARDIEFLESTFEYRGCLKDYHVVKGEGFIAWFNKYSIFLYNGESVIDLNVDDNGQPRLTDWGGTYYNDNSIIGYLPKKKCIFIFNSADKLLQFDIKSTSWSFSSLTIDDSLSNAVTNNAGDIVFIRNNGTNNKLQKWSDTPAPLTPTDNLTLIKTKEIDFGSADSNKNINTVYVNYKQPNTSRIQLRATSAEVSSGATQDCGTLAASTNFTTQKITMPTAFKNIKSLSLEIAAHGTDAIDDETEINDIQIVYRDKVKR